MLVCIGFSKIAFAQSAEEEAEVYYENAEKAYDNKDYINCENALEKCVQKLGVTNSKIDYLRIRNLYDEVSNIPDASTYKNYDLLKNIIIDFFQKVNKNTYPEEKYKDIISIKLAIVDKLDYYNNQKELYARYKKRERTFLTDTVDVCFNAFVGDYNNAWDNLSGSCKRKGFPWGKVAYDSIKRVVFYLSHPNFGFDYRNIRVVDGYIISDFGNAGIRLVSNEPTTDGHSFFPPHRPDPRHRKSDDTNSFCTIDVGNIITDLIQKMSDSGFSTYYRGDYKDLIAN